MPPELAAYAAALARSSVTIFAEAIRPCDAGSNAELRLQEVISGALALYDVSRTVCDHPESGWIELLTDRHRSRLRSTVSVAGAHEQRGVCGTQ